MLPPPPTTRQSSYGFTLPRPSSSAHIRSSSYRLTSHHERNASTGSARQHSQEEDEDEDEDEEEGDLRREMEMELEEQGGDASGERGLEDTLEKLGMGESGSLMGCPRELSRSRGISLAITGMSAQPGSQ
jgi:hypothetical protein